MVIALLELFCCYKVRKIQISDKTFINTRLLSVSSCQSGYLRSCAYSCFHLVIYADSLVDLLSIIWTIIYDTFTTKKKAIRKKQKTFFANDISDNEVYLSNENIVLEQLDNEALDYISFN